MPTSNLPFIGILLTSGISLVLGLLAWWRDRKRDQSTEETAAEAGRIAAKDVATKASESAVRVVQQALDVAAHQIEQQAEQIAELTEKLSELPRLRSELRSLRSAHESCEERNMHLTTRVRELEMAR